MLRELRETTAFFKFIYKIIYSPHNLGIPHVFAVKHVNKNLARLTEQVQDPSHYNASYL